MNEDQARRISRDLEGRTVRGRWRVVSLIGNGDTAVILRAHDDASNEVALKIFDPARVERWGADNLKRRIERQLELGSTDHDSLVNVLDGGYCERTKFYCVVMDLVPGRTLAESLEAISATDVRRVLGALVRAVTCLESHSFVHRDIKPTNIMLADDGRVVLLDYGVLDSFDHLGDGDRSGSFSGTYAYAPPEWVKGDRLTTPRQWKAVTVYQIGAVLHDMLNGRPLFNEHKAPPALFNAIRMETPQIARKRGLEQVREAALACLAKCPNDRLESVDWEALERLATSSAPQTPTIVLLYTGGTIVAEDDPNSSGTLRPRVAKSARDPHLSTIAARLVQRLREYFNPLGHARFNFVWQVLDDEDQIFSENATPEYWNAIARKIGDIVGSSCKEGRVRRERAGVQEEPRVRDIIGVIVLHGTDTLAYTAAALTLSLRNLPLPVLVTGANEPFNERDLKESSDIYGRSDAWKNLLTAIHFLRCVGYRLAEVFVCFGDTVHSGLNIRKTSIEDVALPLDASIGTGNEPFAFRNYSSGRRYLFRLIEGLFCNNYYPSPEGAFSLLARAGEGDHSWCHIASATRELTSPPRVFSGGVVCIKAVPHAATDGAVVAVSKNAAALLIEGYASATYPTDSRTVMAAVVEKCQEEGVPVLLVAPYGARPGARKYQKARSADGDSPAIGDVEVISLYSIIPETAYPLVSMAVEVARRDPRWNGGAAVELYRRRCQLIREAIEGLFEAPHSLFLAEMGNVSNEGEQLDRAAGRLGGDSERSLPGPVPPVDLALEVEGSRVGDRFRLRVPVATLARSDLLWNVEHEMVPYQEAGALPDGFAVQFERGFLLGIQKCSDFMRTGRLMRGQEKTLPYLTESERNERTDKAKALLEGLVAMLRGHGITDVHLDDFEATIPALNPDEPLPPRIKLEFRVTVERHDARFLEDSERFSIQGVSEEDERLLDRLGLMEPKDFDQAVRDLSASKTWVKKSGAMDWYVAGYLKAGMCGVARVLRPDEWSVHCGDKWQDPDVRRALRRSIRMDFVVSDETALELRYTYQGRTWGTF